MLAGNYTAVATPMRRNGSIDYSGFERLIEFNLANGVSGIVAGGTTGETPTLSTAEHRELVERAVELSSVPDDLIEVVDRGDLV